MSKFKALARIARRDLRTHWIRSLVMVLIFALPIGIINMHYFKAQVANSDRAYAFNQIAEGAQATMHLVGNKPIAQNALGDYNNGDNASDEPTSPETRASVVSQVVKALHNVDASSVSLTLNGEVEAVQAPDVLHPTRLVMTLTNLSHNTTRDMTIVRGHAPKKPGEVMLSQVDAHVLGVSVGDDLSLRLVSSAQDSTDEAATTDADTATTNAAANTTGLANHNAPPAKLKVVGIAQPEEFATYGNVTDARSFPTIAHALDQITTGRVDPATVDETYGLFTVSKISVYGNKPVTFTDVKRLNKVGLRVYSRSLIGNNATYDLQGDYKQPLATGVPQEDSGLAIFVYSMLVALFALATVILIPIASLFSQSMLLTGTTVRSVGATRRQWNLVIILTQLILSALGLVIATIVAVAGSYLWLHVTDSPYFNVPFNIWLFIGELIAITIMSTIAGIIANAHIERTLSRVGQVPRQPSKALTWTGVIMTVAGIITLALSFTDVGLFALSPVFALLIVLGVSLCVPQVLRRIDVAFRSAASSQQRSLGTRAMLIAGRDLVRRSHRTIPAVIAIALVTSGAMVFGPLSGAVLRDDTPTTTDMIMDKGGVIIGANNARSDASRTLGEISSNENIVRHYITLGKGHLIDGSYVNYANSANVGQLLHLSADQTAQVAKDLATNDNLSLRVVARAPHHYDGCPGFNPHAFTYNDTIDVDQAKNAQQKAHCHWLESRDIPSYDAQVIPPLDGVGLIVDDGSLLRIGNSSLAKEQAADVDSQFGSHATTGDQALNKAVSTLKNGGVLVGDPALINDGKTTVVLAMFDYRYDKDASDPASSQLHSLTVPAAYWPMFDSSYDSVIASPQVADKLGVAYGPVAKIYSPSSSNTWRDFNALDTAKQRDYQASMLAVNVDNTYGEYVGFLAVILGVVLVITLMMVILTSLEVRHPLQIMSDIGAAPSMKRLFGAWYAALLVLAGLIVGIIGSALVCISILSGYVLSRNSMLPFTTTMELLAGAGYVIGGLLLAVPLGALIGAWLLPSGGKATKDVTYHRL